MKIKHALITLLVYAISGAAFAGPGTLPVPEPETLALLAAGAAAVFIARWIRKK